MKKLQLMVYLIVIIGVFVAYQQGNIHEQEAFFCANSFEADYGIYIEYLYWMESGQCCRFVLDYGTSIYDDVVIVKSCNPAYIRGEK